MMKFEFRYPHKFWCLMIEDKIKMFLTSSSFDLAVFVQLIYWERSCQPRRGGGGGHIFLIKPSQPALYTVLCCTGQQIFVLKNNITLWWSWCSCLCCFSLLIPIVDSSIAFVCKLVHFARWFLRWLYSEGFYLLLYKVFTLYFALLHWLTLYIVRLGGVLCGRLIDRDIVRGRLTATWHVTAIVSSSSLSPSSSSSSSSPLSLGHSRPSAGVAFNGLLGLNTV